MEKCKKKRVLLLIGVTVLCLSGCLIEGGRQSKNSGDKATLDDTSRVQAQLYAEAEVDTDLSSTVIPYYREADTTQQTGTAYENDKPFTIVDYGPREVLPSEMTHPSIYVAFSQPVVPISTLGREQKSSSVMQISPPVDGVFRWYGTRLLSCDIQTELLPQREYTVTLDRELTSLGGKELTGESSFSFRTEYLCVRDFFIGKTRRITELTDVPLEEAGTIHLVFSYPVDLDTIGRYIEINCRGRSYAFTISHPDVSGSPAATSSSQSDGKRPLSGEQRKRTVVLSVEERFPQDSRVDVIIHQGARTDRQSLGIPEQIVKSFHTLTPFRFSESQTYSWRFPRSDSGNVNPVYLRFTHPLEKGQHLPDAISCEPPLEITSEHISTWNDVIKLNHLFLPESSYTLTLHPGIRDIYGRELQEPVQVEVTIPPARRYAYFPNTGSRILEAQFQPRIVWEMQNVFDGVWKAASVTDPYGSFEHEELQPYDFSGMKKNTRHFELLDISPWLNNAGKGCVGIAWNFAERDQEGQRPHWGKQELRLQVTDLAVTTRYAYNRILVWVTSLETGEPVRQAEVSLLRDMEAKTRGATGDDGLVIFPLEGDTYERWFAEDSRRWEDHLRIKVEKGRDTVIFEPNYSHNLWRFGIYNDIYPSRAHQRRMATYLFTDRGIYRPGETVRFKGIDRNISPVGMMEELSSGGGSPGRSQSVLEPYRGEYQIEVREAAYQGKTVYTLEGGTGKSGTFDGSIPLPSDLAPGTYEILYRRSSAPGTTMDEAKRFSFEVAAFRRLGFTVSIEKPDKTYLCGDELTFQVSSTYLSGGVVSGGEYTYRWFKSPARYRPPGEEWEAYHFGPDEGDSRSTLGGESGVIGPSGVFQAAEETTCEGVEGKPYTYELEARVSDVSNQEIADRASQLVHPARYYIGMALQGEDGKLSSPFVAKGEQVRLAYAVVEPDGEPVDPEMIEGRSLHAELYHVTWRKAQQEGVYQRINTRWEKVEELVCEQEIAVTDPEGSFTVNPDDAGSYVARLSGEDREGRSAVSEVSFYVTGSEYVQWGGRDNTEIGLKPEQEVYTPGETARIMVQSPLRKGTYLLTVEREGILDEQLITLEGSANVIEVPIKEGYLPLVYVSLCSYSTRTGEPDHTYFEPDLDKPAGYFGITPLRVDTGAKTIKLRMETDKEVYRPGEEAQVTITALQEGKPLSGAEITFLAADRGVVDLIDYHVPDPLAFFYDEGNFPLGVKGADSRSLLIDPVTYEVKDLKGGDAGDGKMRTESAQEGGAIQTREDFEATAVFEPNLTTDRKGKVSSTFELPDSLTLYRLTAVAVKGDSFGFSEGELPVRNPLTVKTAFPRKLRERDTAVGSVIVTNTSGEARDVEISVAADILTVSGKKHHAFTIDVRETLEVPFTFAAAEAGRAEVRIDVRSDVLDEQVIQELEVEKPHVYESFTTIGQTGPGAGPTKPGTGQAKPGGGTARAEEGLLIPAAVDKSIGGLFLSLGANYFSGFASVFEYLHTYPYRCTEQRVSTMLPLLLFSDYLEDAGIITDKEAARRSVEEELASLARLQRGDGGFPLWQENPDASSMYVTLRAGQLFAYAEEMGMHLPEELDREALLDYLQPEEKWIRSSDYLMLYSLYVRSLFNEDLRYQAQQYFAKGDSIGLSGYGFLGLTFYELGDRSRAKACLERMQQFTRAGTRTIDLTETYEQQEGFHNSEIEQLSLYLMLFSQLDPDSPMVSRIVTTLMNRQKDSSRIHTVTGNWIIQALYFLDRATGQEEPDFTARVRVNERELAETRFRGKASSRAFFRFDCSKPPLKSLERDSMHRLIFEKHGAGTLYYTTTFRYALPSEIIGPRDQGFGIVSSYETLEGEKIQDNVLTAGTTYRARIVLSSHRGRSFVALRVPVISGCDVLNSAFVTTPRYTEYREETQTSLLRAGSGPQRLQRILDNEVRYFWNEFPAGKQEVTFLFRATSSGVYPTPPVTAECMYEPEVFGRTAGRLYFVARKKR